MNVCSVVFGAEGTEALERIQANGGELMDVLVRMAGECLLAVKVWACIILGLQVHLKLQSEEKLEGLRLRPAAVAHRTPA